MFLHLFNLFVYAALLLVIIQVYRYFTKKIPGPIGLPVIGYLPLMYAATKGDSTLPLNLELVKKYGDVIEIPIFKKTLLFLNSPEDIKFFMETKFSSFERGYQRREELSDLLGSGIFNADGEIWKFHRKMAKPIFSEDYLYNVMYPTFIFEIENFLYPLFDKAAESGEPLDLSSAFASYTMRTFLDVGLGAHLEEEEIKQFSDAFNFILSVVSGRPVKPLWRQMDPFDKIEEAKKAMYEIIDLAIEREAADQNSDKMNIMANFYSNEDSSKQEIREGFLNFMIAGRDTTAAAGLWSVYNYYTNIDDSVRAKIDEQVNKFSISETTPQEASDMKYLENYFKEVLRLYPSVGGDARLCIKEETLPSGYTVKPNTNVVYSQYVSGRTKWEDPLTINPERWNDEKDMHRFLFSAFHGGPQICLGKRMSLLELTTMFCAVMKKYNLQLVDPTAGEVFNVNLILSPMRPIEVLVSKK